MSANSSRPPGARLPAPILVLAGLVILAGAWMVPANLKSVNPALLRAAGRDTPSLAQFGEQLVDAEKIGAASIVQRAAAAVGDPRAAELELALQRLEAQEPSLTAWGGWDPSLDPIFHLRSPSGHAESTPVLTFFIPEQTREALARSLSNSGSIGVQILLQTRNVTHTGRFTPALQAGGQPLDALILLTAALYESDHLSPGLQHDVRGMAETAIAQDRLGDLGPFFLDMLALGRRLDWGQLTELLANADSAGTVGELAQLARADPGQFPLIYSAALFSRSPGEVSSYLLLYGKPGAEDLRLAVSDGEGAVRQLVQRQVPVNRSAGPALDWAGALVLEFPELMLLAKYAGYILGLFLGIRGLDRWLVAPSSSREPATGDRLISQFTACIMAVFLAGLVIAATEPYLLKAAPHPVIQPVLHLAALGGSPSLHSQSPKNSLTMDTSTVVSIVIFAILQVIIYTICLKKIRQITQEDLTPQLKMRLMENEENLFDSGLYIGMLGTAAALVLQVLGVIEPNLLAAYSSNLFGIVCVALVKIRHVRTFKRVLILEINAPAGSGAA